MSDDSNRRTTDLYRRTFSKATGLTALGAMAGGMTVNAQENANEAAEEEHPGPDPTERITGADWVSTRDVHEENYEIIHTHRRKEAIRTLLKDPEVNAVASEWIASFEAYDPLTNHLEMVSVQGVPDYSADGSLDEGSWDITAHDRQTIYGLVDRRHNELVALQINDPIEVSWTEEYEEEQLERCRVLYEQSEVQDFLDGKEWWASIKVGEEITGYKDYQHGDVTIVIFPAIDEIAAVVSGYLDISGDEPEFLEVQFVEDFVRYPIQKLAREIQTNEESVLGEVPAVPVEQRPLKTANDGYHRFELVPDQTFEQANWNIEWQPPETMGVTFQGQFQGQPVFEAMNAPVTFTGYDMPPREGRNTLDWFFPDHEPVFNGHHLFWDVHSIPFGGPGALGKIDYPSRRGHPEGFQFKTHYHTGAEGRSSIDFHSGIRFAPYNYNIEYEFYEDGRLVPVWRRHGPGYVTEALYNYGATDEFHEEESRSNVIQQYISAHAFDITPGTEDGVEVQYFDGDSWCQPEEEFYHVGRPGTKLRFTNPNGSQTIDLPMDRDMEAVVVQRKSDEIGPAESQATRVEDLDIEVDFYHPAQYVDGDAIQNERVILWLLLEASMDEVPHPAGVTAYAALGELQLKGY